MKLAGVIVFYNPSIDNINNVYKIEEALDKIFIIDNSDDNIMRIKDTNKIKYIKLNENAGVAKALNIGASEALKKGYKWIITLDQDSIITTDIINKMIDFINKYHNIINIGIVSPYHDIKSGSDDRKDVDYEEVIDIMTSGNIISLDAYKKIGGFKDWLFIDCVDMDYCMNLNKNGYKVIRLNNVEMEHPLGSVKIHKFLGKEYPCYNHPPIRRYYMVRNTLYMKKLYANVYKEYCDHLIKIQIGQIKRILMFENNKINKLKMMYKGYKDFKNNVKGKLG